MLERRDGGTASTGTLCKYCQSFSREVRELRTRCLVQGVGSPATPRVTGPKGLVRGGGKDPSNCPGHLLPVVVLERALCNLVVGHLVLVDNSEPGPCCFHVVPWPKRGTRRGC